MRLRPAVCAVTSASLLALAGCAAEPASDTSSSSSSTSPSPSSSASAESSSSSAAPSSSAAQPSSGGPSFPAQPAPTSAEPSPESAAVLSAITVTAESGYDRVVISFEGPGAPGYVAQYADQASRQGKGDPIELPGDALLDIVMSGTAIPQPGGGLPAGEVGGATGTVVQAVFNDGTFEGQTHVVIGTSGQQPFVVTAQASPAQITIDIQA